MNNTGRKRAIFHLLTPPFLQERWAYTILAWSQPKYGHFSLSVTQISPLDYCGNTAWGRTSICINSQVGDISLLPTEWKLDPHELL